MLPFLILLLGAAGRASERPRSWTSGLQAARMQVHIHVSGMSSMFFQVFTLMLYGNLSEQRFDLRAGAVA